MARKGLGKGLDSLISDEYTKNVEKNTLKQEKTRNVSTKTSSNVEKSGEKDKNTLQNAKKIPIIKVERNPDQPRQNFDEEALEELAQSIRQHGILQPLLVKPVEDHFIIIAGERRWRAARLAGLKEVPAIVKDYSESEIMEISLIENIQREDLNVIEEAQAYQKLLTEFGYRHEDLAKKISRSRAAISNRLRLLKLSQPVREMLTQGKISEGHARAILSLENEELQIHAASMVAENQLSVRETEKLVKNLLNPRKRTKDDSWKTANQFIYDQLEEDLRNCMGTKVEIQRKEDQKGKIVIDYYSNDELERIIDLIKKAAN